MQEENENKFSLATSCVHFILKSIMDKTKEKRKKKKKQNKYIVFGKT